MLTSVSCRLKSKVKTDRTGCSRDDQDRGKPLSHPDELTAPDPTAPLIKSIQTAGGAVSKFIGVLAESPAALRSYMRLRSELRKGEADPGHARANRSRTRRAAGRRLHAQPVRTHGPRRGGSASARSPAPASSLRRTRRRRPCWSCWSRSGDKLPPSHLVEEAREASWSDSQILEALAEMSLAMFQSIVATAAELPLESSDPAVLRSAAA